MLFISHLHFSRMYLRLHHRAGSKPVELHGSVYEVACLDCGTSIDRESFQEQVKDLNPKVCLFDSCFFFSLSYVHYISSMCCTYDRNSKKILNRC